MQGDDPTRSLIPPTQMAVQTMMLNQDRCTKNFFTYFNSYTGQWQRFPWDLESAFGISAGERRVTHVAYQQLF